METKDKVPIYYYLGSSDSALLSLFPGRPLQDVDAAELAATSPKLFIVHRTEAEEYESKIREAFRDGDLRIWLKGDEPTVKYEQADIATWISNSEDLFPMVDEIRSQMADGVVPDIDLVRSARLPALSLLMSLAKPAEDIRADLWNVFDEEHGRHLRRVAGEWEPLLSDNSIPADEWRDELRKKLASVCFLGAVSIRRAAGPRTCTSPIENAWARAGVEVDDQRVEFFSHRRTKLRLDAWKIRRLPRNTWVVVFGTISREEFVAQSWRDLSLNLLDSPNGEGRGVFQYVPVSEAGTWKLPATPPSETDIAFATNLVDASCCHQFNVDLRTIVRHGKSDKMQVAPASVVRRSLEFLLSKYSESLVCPRCKRLRGELLREVDALDEDDAKGRDLTASLRRRECRLHRLMTWGRVPSAASEQAKTAVKDTFERIVIVENDKDVAAQLQLWLRKYVAAEDHFVIADPEKSVEMRAVMTAEGKDALKELQDKKIDLRRVLVTFDLHLTSTMGLSLDSPTPPTTSGTVSGLQSSGDEWEPSAMVAGHGVLYRTLQTYSAIVPIVITGYRSEEHFALDSGAAVVLIKPFSEVSLRRAVESAQKRSKVVWLCPPRIKRDYNALLEELGDTRPSFDLMVTPLEEWAQRRGVDLTVITAVTAGADVTVATSDVVIVDIFEAELAIGEVEAVVLDQQVREIRSMNPEARIIAIVPPLKPEGSAAVRRLTQLRLSSEEDLLFVKPGWVVAGEELGRESLAGCIDDCVRAKRKSPLLDVRYQILVPLGALLGRCTRSFHEGAATAVLQPALRFAPLLPILIHRYGRACSLAALSGDTTVGDRLRDDLKRLGFEGGPAPRSPDLDAHVQTSVANFLSSITDIPFVTLQEWLESALSPDDEDARRENPRAERFRQIVGDLERTFGGSTKVGIGEGAWYNEQGEHVIDLPIIIEFAAHSSLVSRRFIEDTLVRELIEHCGEEAVMVSEVRSHARILGPEDLRR